MYEQGSCVKPVGIPQEKRELEIPSLLARLADRTEILSYRYADLESRLCQVSNVQQPTNPQTSAEKCRNTPIGNQIWDIIRVVEGITDRVNTSIDLLEV